MASRLHVQKLAEIAGKYLKKGSQVYIEGKLQTRKWADSNGVEKYTTEIIANEMQMLGSSAGDCAASNRSNQKPQSQSPASSSAGNDFDDDIPF